MVDQYANVPQYRVRLAGALKYRGTFLEHAGKTRQAADAFRREFDLDKALCTEFPTVADYALQTAMAAQSFLRCSNARGVDAAKWSRQELASVLTNLKTVAANPPEDPDFRRALAQALRKLGNGLNSVGEAAAAASAFQESILLYRRLVQQSPNDLQSIEALGHTLRYLAFDWGPAPEHRGDVERAFREAIDAFQGLTVRAPKKLIYWHFLADTHRLLAQVFVDARRPDEAEQEFRRAIEIDEAALEKLHVAPFDEGWALSYLDLVRFLESKGRAQAAEEVVRRFTSRIERSGSAFPKSAAHRERLARLHHEVANSLRDVKRINDAESHYRQALVQYDALVADSGTKPEYQLKTGRVAAILP